MSDLPAIAFAEDFVREYREVKVVVVERDVEMWIRSF